MSTPITTLPERTEDPCTRCAGTRTITTHVSRWFACDDHDDGGFNRTEYRAVPCPACTGEQVERTMTLGGWDWAIEYASEVQDQFDLDPFVTESWEWLVHALARDVEVTLVIPKDFDAVIQDGIDDAEGERQAAQWM